MARWPKTNTVENMERIKADVLEAAQDYVKAYCEDRPGRLEAPTVNGAWQLMKMAVPLEYAQDGRRMAFEKELTAVSGGNGFLDEVATYDQAQKVGQWLGMDPDAILEQFEGTEIESKYRECAWMGFWNQVDDGVRQGYHVEFAPTPRLNERKSLPDGWNFMNTTVRVYEDGRLLGEHSLPEKSAEVLYHVLNEDALDNGMVLQTLKHIGNERYDMMDLPVSHAMCDLAVAIPRIKDMEAIITDFAYGELGEDPYYAAMDRLDAGMRNDRNLSVLVMECVDLHTDRYFKNAYYHDTSKAYRNARSGRTAPVPNADKPAKTAEPEVSKDAAMAKQSARDQMRSAPIRKQTQTR